MSLNESRHPPPTPFAFPSPESINRRTLPLPSPSHRQHLPSLAQTLISSPNGLESPSMSRNHARSPLGHERSPSLPPPRGMNGYGHAHSNSIGYAPSRSPAPMPNHPSLSRSESFPHQFRPNDAYSHPPLNRSESFPHRSPDLDGSSTSSAHRHNLSLLHPPGGGIPISILPPNWREDGMSKPPATRAETGRGGSSDDETHELTTKGRKRKRLAKACSACHKNKRRCDGFAPCSNCEFSSRECVYVNAQGEVIPPPRVREPAQPMPDSALSAGSMQLLDTSPSGEGSRLSGEGGVDDGPISRSRKKVLHIKTPSPARRQVENRNGTHSRNGFSEGPSRAEEKLLHLVDTDVSVSAELIQIFFSRLHPWAAIFHPPTFHHRRYLVLVAPYLLDAIYALSLPHAENASVIAASDPYTPAHARGRAFAERAHVRLAGPPVEGRFAKGCWEELEFAQTLLLLGLYHVSIDDIGRARPSFAAAFDVLSSPTTTEPSLKANGYHYVEEGATEAIKTRNMTEKDRLTQAEARNRTFTMLAMYDLLTASGTFGGHIGDIHFLNRDLDTLSFTPEVEWSRLGHVSDDRTGPGRSMVMGNSLNEETRLGGELSHVGRIVWIFSEIMQAVYGRPKPSDIDRVEQGLKTWAGGLPSSLRFDELSLSKALDRLRSQISAISRSGWLFCFMHALAECSVFHLHGLQGEAKGIQGHKGSEGDLRTSERQGQAVDDIVIVLDAVGPRGREGFLMLIPLLTVTRWQDHLRQINSAPTARVTALDERLNTWWGELSRRWGLDRSAILERTDPRNVSSRYAKPSSRRPEPSPRNPVGLGLYGTSPPPARGPDSTISTISSMTLPTPSPASLSTNWFQGNGLIDNPGRARAHTVSQPGVRSPSPSNPTERPAVNRQNVSWTSSDSIAGLKLPPLPAIYQSQTTKPAPPPDYFDLPIRNGSDKHLSIQTPASVDGLMTSPRFDPYEEERKKRWMNAGPTSPTHATKEKNVPKDLIPGSANPGTTHSPRAETGTPAWGSSMRTMGAASVELLEGKKKDEKASRPEPTVSVKGASSSQRDDVFGEDVDDPYAAMIALAGAAEEQWKAEGPIR